jgi:flagellar biosynthesis protein FliP
VRAARNAALLVTVVALALIAFAPGAAAQDQPAPGGEPALGEEAPDDIEAPGVPDVPDLAISIASDDPALSRTVVIVLLLTLGSVAPGLLLLMTSFTRFIIVLGLAKNALALQTVPPAQVLIGLAMFLTFFVMGPVLGEVNTAAIQPLLAGEIGQREALEAGYEPLRQFMLAQTREDDLRMFMSLSDAPQPSSPEEVGPTTLIPSFVISELRTAFIIGFVIFVPFLVIDLVVASVLMSMGMVMLPPVFISLPLKLLLFVLVDGWVLVTGSLVNSVNGVVF